MGSTTFFNGKNSQIGTIIAPMKVLNRKPVTASGYSRLTQAARHLLAVPSSSTDFTAGGRIVTTKLNNSNRRLVQCSIQNNASASTKKFTVDCWGIRPPLGSYEALSVARGSEEPDEYLPELLFSAVFTQGAGVVNPSSVKLATLATMTAHQFADTFTVTDYTRAADIKAWTNVASGAITLDFDAGGFERLMFECTPDANCGGHLLLGEL